MPSVVVDKKKRSGGLEFVPEAASVAGLEMVSRNCKLNDKVADIIRTNIKAYSVQSEMIGYASPDSTYAVTKKLLDSAKRSVLIGIYDFSSSYIRDILLNLMARGVKVSLMLDLDGSKGEYELFKKLGSLGAEVVPAPSCASEKVHYFSSSHEKVIVIDGEWVMVQSGNYSNNSIPLNEVDGGDPAKFVKGNRDMGIAVRSKPLAKFFTEVLRGDMDLELKGLESVTKPPKELPMLVEAAPKLIPKQLFKSKSWNPATSTKVTPILSPDNYMDVIPEFLKSAKRSIYIEQQYIRSTQKHITTLLDAIGEAMVENPVDVKIILGKIFDKKDIPKEKANLENMKNKYGLKLGPNIRFIDTSRFVHCHNKLIVVDDKTVLISSQNWSDSAVSKNREAGLLIEHAPIAKYFSGIFASDWETGIKTLPSTVGSETVDIEEVQKGGYIEVSPGDYAEV